MTRYFIIILTLIFTYDYYQIVVKCSDTLHEINTKGMTAYVNIIRSIVQNSSNSNDDLINTKEKFHIGLNRIRRIYGELYNITDHYNNIDKLNVIYNFENLDNSLESRYHQIRTHFFDITENDVNEELYTKLSTEYTEKNHQDLQKIREQILPKIKPETSVYFQRASYKTTCDYNFSLAKSYFYIYQQLIMLELTSFLTETFIYFLYSYCQFGLKKLKEHDNLMFNKYNNSTEQLQINLDSYKNTFLKFANSFSVNDLYGCKYGPISYAEIIHSESNISINHYNVLSHESNCSYAKCEFPVFQNDESFRFQIGEYHSSKPCYGKLMQCSSVDTVELYYASRLSSKYYEGLKFNEEIYGNINSSPNETHTISLSQWSIKKCDICICTCPVYPLNRNMYKLYGKISFMEETSDILNNAVVTNVKFVGLNNTVFMLIEQRPLSVLKLNSNNDENAWKPLSVPWSAMEMSQAYKNNTYGHIIHGNGLSYGEIHINTTILHLDDIILPFGHVVTGVKFSFKTNESNIIQIQVRATPYNFITNKLIIMNNNGEPTSFWITAESMDSSKMPEYQRKRMTRSGDIKYDLVPNQSILFYTSRIRNSGSQIVGPGFDTRLTTSKWPFPLRGVGITIKTYNGKDPSVELKTFPYTIPPIN